MGFFYDHKKEIISVAGGAILGGVATFLIMLWDKAEKTLELGSEKIEQAELKSLITEAKEEAIDDVKNLLMEAGQQKGRLITLIETVNKNAAYIENKKSEIETITSNLKAKTDISDDDIRRIFEEEIISKINVIADRKINSLTTTTKQIAKTITRSQLSTNGKLVEHRITRGQFWNNNKVNTVGHECADGSFLVGVFFDMVSAQGVRAPEGITFKCASRLKLE